MIPLDRIKGSPEHPAHKFRNARIFGRFDPTYRPKQ